MVRLLYTYYLLVLNYGREHRYPLRISSLLSLCLLGLGIGQVAQAQIIPDGTLGLEGSVVTPDFIFNDSTVDLIEGGALRANVLFHSFSEFNVDNGQLVYFADPAVIDHIVGRVTGVNVSNILGTLGVDGDASLYLTNPNGVVFGPDAELDIRSSFVATTADRFILPSGTEFSATNPQGAPLLGINLVPGLQYGDLSTGEIANTGNLLTGEDLTLAANGLDLQGRVKAGGDLTLYGQEQVQIRDSVASPFIGSANGELLIQGSELVDIFILSHPESGLFSGRDMVLRSRNPVSGDAHFLSYGDFNIEQLDGSLGTLFSPHDPVIRTGGNISFDQYTGDSLHIFAGGSVYISGIGDPPFSISIAGQDTATGLTENIVLSNGEYLTVDGQNRPTVDIRAGTLAFEPTGNVPTMPSGFQPSIPELSASNSRADIIIDGIITTNSPEGMVLLTNQYQPNGNDGNIEISKIDTTTAPNTQNPNGGNGGDVIIDSRNDILFRPLTDSDPGGIDTSTSLSEETPKVLNVGNAGDITLIVNDDIFVNSGVVASTTAGSGNGGNINIETSSLFLTDSGSINVGTSGNGNGGNIEINAKDTVLFDQISSANSTVVEPDLSGPSRTRTVTSGNIKIDADVLLVTNSSSINANTENNGDAGNIIIDTRERVEVTGDNSTIIAQASSEGQAGSVTITTDEFFLDNGAVSVGFLDPDSIDDTDEIVAGDINITARRLSIDNIGQIIANTTVGDGGNINLTLGELLLLRRASLVSTTAGREQAGGDGGNITIVMPDGFIVGLAEEDTDIAANAFTGDGGRVDITAVNIYGLEFRDRDTPLSDITASSEFGQSGEVLLDTVDIDPLQGAEELPGDFAPRGIDTSCQPGGSRRNGQFTMTGRGGLPSSPQQLFEHDDFGIFDESGSEDSSSVIDTQRLNTNQNSESQGNEDLNDRIIEAQGLVVEGDKAQLVLEPIDSGSNMGNRILSQSCYL